MRHADSPWDDDDDDEVIPLDQIDEGLSAYVLDALDMYAPTSTPDGGHRGWASIDPVADDEDDRPQTLLFTLTNPPDTVSVTAALNGRIHHVELSPQVTKMTEHQLAEEIAVLARLVQQRARAAQHALIVELMSQLGHDRPGTASFLEHTAGLPSPDTVSHAVAHEFRTRYRNEDE